MDMTVDRLIEQLQELSGAGLGPVKVYVLTDQGVSYNVEAATLKQTSDVEEAGALLELPTGVYYAAIHAD